MAINDETYWTINDLVKKFQVERCTVHRWLSAGCRGRVLGSVLIGGRRLIPESALRAFMDVTEGDDTEKVSDVVET